MVQYTDRTRRTVLRVTVATMAAVALATGGAVAVATTSTPPVSATTPATFLVGAAPNSEPGSTAEARMAAADAKYGPLTAHRSYSQPGDGTNGVITDFMKTPAASDVGKRASIYSFHPNPKVNTSALFRQLVDSIPAGHTAFLVPDHEADGMVRRGQLTPAEYTAIMRSYGPIVRDARAHGHPHVYLVMNVCGYLWNHNNHKGPKPETMWPGAGIVDVVTADTYGTDDWPDAAAPAQFGGVYQYAVDHDTPWGVLELGAQEDPHDTGHKARWIENHFQFAATHGSGGYPSAVMVSYFDSDTNGSVPTPSSSAAAIAAAKALSERYHRAYTDPGI